MAAGMCLKESAQKNIISAAILPGKAPVESCVRAFTETSFCSCHGKPGFRGRLWNNQLPVWPGDVYPELENTSNETTPPEAAQI